MRIAYVTTFPSADIHMWSGCAWSIREALAKQGAEIIPVDSFPEYSDLSILLKRIYFRLVHPHGYRPVRDTKVLKELGKAVFRRLEKIEFDLVFSPGTLPLSYLETDKPVAFWSDATFAGLVDFYPDMKGLCAHTIKSGLAAEQSILSRCRAAIFCSEWARATALDNYDVSPTKTHVVPFGANIECLRGPQDIEEIAAGKSTLSCRLLLFGMGWERKGADLAVKVAEGLNQKGLPTELTVMGSTAPDLVPSYVKVLGFVSKKTEEGRQLIDETLRQSHFLLMPSRAECLGIVGAEANSFGIPALTSDVGGFSTLITPGRNGFSFPLDTYVEKAIETVQHYWREKAAYHDLVKSSFAEYQSRLNWDVAGKRVYAILENILARP